MAQRPNTHVTGVFNSTADVVGPYRYRWAEHQKTSIAVRVYGDCDGDCLIYLCEPSMAQADGILVETLSAGDASTLVIPGGDCDIYCLAGTVTSGTSNVHIV